MSFERAEIPILTSIANLSRTRKVWLCDVWGVLHNGETAFPSAVNACRMFRKQGGVIVLVSNSPRPSAGLIDHLHSLGINENSFDFLVTSGDVTLALLAARPNEPIFHLGPERDHDFFDGLNVKFVEPKEASVIVCTGLFEDEIETPEDYDGMLKAFAERRVPMICANPDLVVERGSRLLPCAGALAVRYAALGQTVIQAGKPYRPIYDLAFQKLGQRPAHDEILAIGDGIDTDIKGACELNIDGVYIASHVHLAVGETGELSTKSLQDLFHERSFRPIAALAHLAW